MFVWAVLSLLKDVILHCVVCFNNDPKDAKVKTETVEVKPREDGDEDDKDEDDQIDFAADDSIVVSKSTMDHKLSLQKSIETQDVCSGLTLKVCIMNI